MKKDINVFLEKIVLYMWDDIGKRPVRTTIEARPILQQKLLDSERLKYELTLHAATEEVKNIDLDTGMVEERATGWSNIELNVNGAIEKVSQDAPLHPPDARSLPVGMEELPPTKEE